MLICVVDSYQHSWRLPSPVPVMHLIVVVVACCHELCAVSIRNPYPRCFPQVGFPAIALKAHTEDWPHEGGIGNDIEDRTGLSIVLGVVPRWYAAPGCQLGIRQSPRRIERASKYRENHNDYRDQDYEHCSIFMRTWRVFGKDCFSRAGKKSNMTARVQSVER